MRRTAQILVPLLALSAAPYAAHAQDKEESTARYVSRSDGRTIDATVVGDRVTVLVDGVRVPDDRVKRQNNFVTILDENGKELGRFYVMTNPAGTYTSVGAADLARAAASGEARLASSRLVLGVMLENVSEALAAQLGIHTEHATLIRSVVDGSAAADAGVEPFDILVGVEDEKAGNSAAIRAVLDKRKPGDRVRLHVIRKGERKTLTATLRAAPATGGVASVAPAAPRARGGVGVAGEASRQAETRAMRERELAEAEQRRTQVLQERLAKRQGELNLFGQQHREQADQLRAELLDRFRAAEGKFNFEGRINFDEQSRKGVEEALRRATEALKDIELNIELPQIEILRDRERANSFVFMPAPRAPRAPAALRPATPPTDDRFQRLEQRMDRLESLLETLIERLETQGR